MSAPEEMTLKVIAHIRTAFPTKFGIPRQSGLVDSLRGEVIFTPEYRNADAVRGLEDFSHIWLVWQFSGAVRDSWSPTVRPPRLGGNTRMGVFATRSPFRPNPLGLHDMLGNVREMTLSQYHIEYYQGRSGGFAARGGHFLVAEKDMACALRTEEPYYLGSADKGMRPNVKPTMGLRLVLSAPVLTDRDSIAAIEDAWETHRSGAGADLPAALSVADVAAQEAVPARAASDIAFMRGFFA